MPEAEWHKRAEALRFATEYMRVHQCSRATALRIADLALRFLDGEEAEEINKDADAASVSRERQHHPAHQRNRISDWPVSKIIKRMVSQLKGKHHV